MGGYWYIDVAAPQTVQTSARIRPKSVRKVWWFSGKWPASGG